MSANTSQFVNGRDYFAEEIVAVLQDAHCTDEDARIGCNMFASFAPQLTAWQLNYIGADAIPAVSAAMTRHKNCRDVILAGLVALRELIKGLPDGQRSAEADRARLMILSAMWLHNISIEHVFMSITAPLSPERIAYVQL